jgi:ketosteroid isomerase-like protein
MAVRREEDRASRPGDVRSQMELVSRDPQVTSTVMGETWRGWDAIRAQSEAYVTISKRIRNVITGVEVIGLGPTAAIAVVPFRSERRDTADHAVPEFQQSLALVLRPTPAGWRMVHEHVGVKIPQRPAPE